MKFLTIFFLIGNLLVFSSPMAIEQVLYNLSGNNHLSSVGVDDLQQIANEFPFFAPAQFLLALKQKEQSSYSYNGQIQKAALHFSNPLWLQYQLHNGSIAEPVLEKVILNGQAKQTVVAQPAPEVVEAPIVQPTAYAAIPVVEEAQVALPTEVIAPIVAPQVESEIPVLSEIIEEVKEEAHVVTDIVTNEAKIEAVANNVIEELPIAPIVAPVSEAVNDSGIVDYTSFALSNSLKDVAPIVKTDAPLNIETLQAPLSDNTITNSFDNNSGGFAIPTLEAVKRLLDVNTPSTPIAPAIQVEVPKSNVATIPSYSFNGFADAATEIAPNAVALSEAFTEEEVEVLEEEDKHPVNNIASVLSSQIADFKKPITEDDKLEFDAEPLFKVDYFASQGIKIDLTKQPQDKLTVQLRRFTDWLRQIKGQGPNPPQDLGTDPELEKAIANIAKTSIAAREIVTETMADVFIKQGKVDKAIQLYIKLSFLDPEKSAYFAGKIQQLKGI
jgi:hypothetical protein